MLLIQEWWPPAKLGQIGPSASENGPIRPKRAVLSRGIVLGGHSSLQPANYDGILAATVGPVMSDGDRQSSQEVWEANGPAHHRHIFDHFFTAMRCVVSGTGCIVALTNLCNTPADDRKLVAPFPDISFLGETLPRQMRPQGIPITRPA